MNYPKHKTIIGVAVFFLILAFTSVGQAQSLQTRNEKLAIVKQQSLAHIYAIVVGISNYKSDKLNLSYATKNAENFAQALEFGASKIYGVDKIHIRLLTNNGKQTNVKFNVVDAKTSTATKTDFIQAFDDFKNAQPWDIFVLYLAGQSISLTLNQKDWSGEDEETYLYLTQDATTADKSMLSIENLRQSMTVSSKELSQFLTRRNPLRNVVIFDTCAEGTVKTLIAKCDVPSEQSREIERFRDRTGSFVSFPRFRIVGGKGGEATTLYNLMFTWNKLNNSEFAIFYGKQLINKYQELYKTINDLDKEFQRAYYELVEEHYRYLANIMIADERILEAQFVLNLLKEKEYKQLSRSGEISDTVPYSKTEADVVAKIENLAELGRRQSELQKEQKESGDKFTKQPELDKVLADIEIANKAFRESLTALSKTEKSVENQVAEIQSEKNLQRALSQLSKELNTGAVAIYTVIGTEEEKDENGKIVPDKTRSKFGWVILVTPEGRKAYPIDVTDLETTVFRFRDALSSDKYDPQPLAEKIYKAIFRQTSDKQKTTLEADLETYFAKYKDKTIMWSLDGILRYIPMAALHDGRAYLVEKYRQTLFTKQSLLMLNEKDAAQWQALGLGVSAGNSTLNMSALPGAEKELKDIVKTSPTTSGIFDGAIRLNDDFKKEEVLRLWREGKYPVVHIATHFSFNALDQTASFLLIGDGKLTFADIQDKDNLFGTVDLLTLSACDTGLTANGKESEGFAYLAQSLGAKSVIASLWKVSDTGTPELMIRFYKKRAENPAMSKGEAFRQAQLSLLGAETKTATSDVPRSGVFNPNGKEIKLSLFVKDAKKQFAHPHYWASFVLIGNWR